MADKVTRAWGSWSEKLDRWWDVLTWKCNDRYEEVVILPAADYDALTQALAEARAERDTFYMDYRKSCDEETKRLVVENERLRAELASLKRGRIAVENLVRQQAQIPPEFAQVLDDNFWNLV